MILKHLCQLPFLIKALEGLTPSMEGGYIIE
jgi:hypothetical protein